MAHTFSHRFEVLEHLVADQNRMFGPEEVPDDRNDVAPGDGQEENIDDPDPIPEAERPQAPQAEPVPKKSNWLHGTALCAKKTECPICGCVTRVHSTCTKIVWA